LSAQGDRGRDRLLLSVDDSGVGVLIGALESVVSLVGLMDSILRPAGAFFPTLTGYDQHPLVVKPSLVADCRFANIDLQISATPANTQVSTYLRKFPAGSQLAVAFPG